MIRKACAKTLVFFVISLGTACSSSKQMDREGLRSAVAQVVSIAEEGQLFTEFVQDGHATPTYARTHPEYLKVLADTASHEIVAAKPGPELRAILLKQLQD